MPCISPARGASSHGANVLRRYFEGPVEVIPEGIDPLAFPYVERKAPSPQEPFRFFWHNLAIRAKGIDLVMAAWKAWGQSGRRPPNCELYVKDDGRADGGKIRVPMEQPKRTTDFFSLPDEVRTALSCGYAPGAIIDRRNLPAAELTELYHSAHAYVSASYGEGFGFTIAQALAAGLPTIYTALSAPCDYADESTAFPVTDFEMEPVPCVPGANLHEAMGARDARARGLPHGLLHVPGSALPHPIALSRAEDLTCTCRILSPVT